MFESKYSKVLTVILVIVIIAILVLLGFLGYDYYQKYAITKDTSEFVDNFQGEISSDVEPSDEPVETEPEQNENNENDDPFGGIQDANTSSGGGTTTNKTYQGFTVLRNNRNPSNRNKIPNLR